MKKYILRLTCLLILSLFSLNVSYAQLEWSKPFMNNTLTQSNLSNPALFSDFNVSITIPSVQLGFTNSGFKFSDVLSHNENVLFLNTDQLLSKIAKRGLSLQTQLNVETFGLNIQGEKWLFNIHHGVRMIGVTEIPTETIEFALKGNTPFIDETIQLGFRQNALAYQEIGLALAFQIKNKMTIGGRVKYLKGIAAIQTSRSNASLYTNPEYYQLTAETDYVLQTGGLPGGDFENLDPFNLETLDTKLLGPNKGFAVDLGMTYQINKKLSFDASINNIGWINWNENAYHYTSKGGYEFDGIDVKPFIEDENYDLNQIVDTVSAIFQFVDTEESFKTVVPANAYASVRYELASRLYASGFLYVNKYNEFMNYAGGINLKKDFGAVWTLGTQYAYHNHGGHNVGLMTALRLGPIQLYAMTDNVFPFLDPLDTQHFNFRTGLNLTFGNKFRKRRKALKKQRLNGGADENDLQQVETIPLDKEPVGERKSPAPTPVDVVDDLVDSLSKIETPSIDSIAIKTTADSLVQIETPIIDSTLTDLIVNEPAIDSLLKIEKPIIETTPTDSIVIESTIDSLREEIKVEEVVDSQRVIEIEKHLEDSIAQKLEELRVLLDQQKQIEEQEQLEALKVKEEQERLEREKLERERIERERLAAEAARIEEEARQQAIENQPAPVVSNYGTFYVTKKTSFREAADHTSRVLKRIDVNAEVIVLEKTSIHWWKCEYKGNVGYVKALLLKQ